MKIMCPNWNNCKQFRDINYWNTNYVDYTPVKMTASSGNSLTTRIHRKVLRVPSKRHPGKVLPGKLASVAKITPGKRIIPRLTPPICDNSNDSGLGFDRSLESQYHNSLGIRPLNQNRSIRLDDDNGDSDNNNSGASKRIKVNSIDIDTDDACSNEIFEYAQQNKKATITSNDDAPTTTAATIPASSSTISNNANNNSSKLMNPTIPRKMPGKRTAGSSAVLNSQVTNFSRDGKVQLQILAQPEQQHRARYQTEGSRGAVKDRSGNGFPVVRLSDYNKPAVLQVFIGTDIGRVAPHMFYQACKVSGKNSTPCTEKKHEGTIVIEVDMKPENEMTVTCDCVGILKERNVDVEHRFPEQSGARSKKKSTRCRMVFRTVITNADGSTETLQACSQQIVCTQPPGVPEICRKSLVSCPVDGGLDLFVIGKNFLKDTRVVFQKRKSSSNTINLQWEESVVPDKEYLQQTHLVCTVPPYLSQDILEPTIVQIFITSGGKKSETHNFTYTPQNSHTAVTASTSSSSSYFNAIQSSPTKQITNNGSNSQDAIYDDANNNSNGSKSSLFMWNSSSVETKNELDSGMMPPPVTVLPMNVRRSSLLADQMTLTSSPTSVLKSEMIDENTRSPINDDSLERFPGSNDNSMEGGSIMYRRRPSLREQNMEIMEDNSNMSMIVNESTMDINTMSSIVSDNSINVFHQPQIIQSHIGNIMETSEINNPNVPSAADLKIMDLRIKQEQMAVNNQFIANNNNMTTQMQVENLFSSQQNPIESTFTSALISHVNSEQHHRQIMEIPNTTGTSNPNNQPSDVILDSTTSNRSPLSQDIILNSQSVISLNQNSLGMMAQPQGVEPISSISPEIILNPTISPSSMMCASTNDPNNILNNMAVITAQNSQLLTPIIEPQPDNIHIPRKDSSTAAKNMILNAAAEILTSQEPSVTTQSTINALMSYNSSEIRTNTCQQAQMLPGVMMTQCNPVVVPTTNTIHQQQQQQFVQATINTILNDNLQQQQQQQQQQLNNQESLLQNVLQRHMHQQEMNTAASIAISKQQAVQQQVQQHQQQQQQQQQQQTASAAIPQELTTMSDNDLINLINPNCFI